LLKGSADPLHAKALYLSYDGMCDPLGASQVLPYLFGLARRGHRITLISFEKAERTEGERDAVRKACEEAGISWHPLPYHRRPPVLSTIYDVAALQRLAIRLHRRERFDLVHCRGYVTALVGLALKRRMGVSFLFDMRGFWADERRESGSWNQANPIFRSVYRYFKRRERDFWDEADQMISLTESARDAIAESDPSAAPIAVIPCCVDFELFRPPNPKARASARAALGIGASERVLVYIGSLGGNYMLGEMLDLYRAYRQRHGAAKFLFVTHTPESLIRSAAARKKLPGNEMVVRAASRAEVPMLTAAADEGISFIEAVSSKRAASPTKLGEMLALNIPVITNAGVGDVDRIIDDAGSGVIVRRFDDAAYEEALTELDQLKPDPKRWRDAVHRWFDLETGIERYDAIYQRLANAGVGARRPNSN
jgi:glycosyltransferase involved in cell wall biosynthesis